MNQDTVSFLQQRSRVVCVTLFPQIQPIDMVKVRIQLLPDTPGVVRNPFSVARTVVKESGVRGLYKG